MNTHPLSRMAPAIGLSCVLMACGGSEEPAPAPSRAPTVNAPQSAATDGLVPMYALFNFSLRPSVRGYEDPNQFVSDLVDILDEEGIPIWLDRCYNAPDERPGVGTPGFPPYVLVGRVKAEHQARLQALGLRPMDGPLPDANPNTGCNIRWVGSVTLRTYRVARQRYPQYFYGGVAESETEVPGWFDYGPYRYAYFTNARNYLGLIGEEIYVHNGRDWKFLHVGNIRQFVPTFVANPPAAAGSSASAPGQ